MLSTSSYTLAPSILNAIMPSFSAILFWSSSDFITISPKATTLI